MPVTAHLIQRLHETLGDDATNDLLAWLEESVVTRTDLRAVTDAQGQRISAEFSQVRTEMAALKGELRAEIAQMEGRLRVEMATLEGRLRADMGALEGRLRAEIAATRADMKNRMFLFWAGTVIPLAGLMVALNRL